MSVITDFLINSLSGALESIGESKLEELLQNLHDEHPEEYLAALYGGHALVKALNPIVSGTTNKIDDAIIGALDEAINNSAAKNGVTLVVVPVAPKSLDDDDEIPQTPPPVHP